MKLAKVDPIVVHISLIIFISSLSEGECQTKERKKKLKGGESE